MRVLLLMGLVGVLVSCSPPAAAGCEQTVEMTDTFTFSPNTVAVKKGGCVKFKNVGSSQHNVVAGANKLVDNLPPGQSGDTPALEIPGEINYVCGFHPGMTGKITVNP